MNLYTINTGYFKLDGGAMFGVVPKSIWNKLYPADENNMCPFAMRCLLVEDGNRLILIDNGIGSKQDAKFFSHYCLHGDDTLEKSLAQHGFGKDDITDVFLSHLHFDHCGGSVERQGDKLVPAFKNAVYWSNAAHWNWAVYPNDREKASFLKENILPLQESGQLQFVEEAPGASLTENFQIHFVNGHTQSMMLPKIRYKEQTVVFLADLIPAAAGMPIPYVMAYDMFPLTTMNEKKTFLKEAYENNYVLFFEHDATHECCSLQLTEKGVRPAEFFKVSDV